MILVFKTNILSRQTQEVKEVLERVNGIQNVSFDLEA